MKAVVCTKYGPPEVLRLTEIPVPAPGDNEVLIKVFAATVTIGDTRVRAFNVPLAFRIPARFALGFWKPKKAVLGMEVAGVIESTGRDVTRFKKGDKVFAYPGFTYFGGYAEFCCLPEDRCIVKKPDNISFEEAAALPFGGLTALEFLHKANIKQGDDILVYGASGSVGTYTVQIAKYFGANVTAVCSTVNVDMVKSLGAEKVIDYTQTDFTKVNKKYDIVFDAVGKSPIFKTIKLIKPGGVYIHVVSTSAVKLFAFYALKKNKVKFIGGSFKLKLEQMEFLKILAGERKIKPVIDKQFPLENIVEAHRYVDKGHKRGNVIINVANN